MKKKPGALILFNEKSGIGKASTVILAVIRKAAAKGYEPIVYPIVPGTDLTSEKLVELYDGKVELVLVSGGDGTMNHLVDAVMRMKHKPRIAYLPTGSTNDFARGLGIPLTKPKGIETAFGGRVFNYDVGSMNGRFFNYVAAFGAFSNVSYETKTSWKNVLGYAAYVLTAAGNLVPAMKYSQHLRVITESSETDGNFVFGALCNAVTVGGLNIFGKSDVKLNDGKMELLMIYETKNLVELQAIAAALLSGKADHPNISIWQVDKVRIESDNPVSWSLDGEFGGETNVAEFEVHKNAISIMTGRKKR